MPNEIYTTTRDGLSALVSRQVADAVLQRALRAHGSDGEAVDASLMSRVLRGEVRRALERSLPRSGVRRVLVDLDAQVARMARSEPEPETDGVAAPPSPLPSAPARRRGADAPPTSVLDRLGDQDAVRQWVWVPYGRAAVGRGAGPEPHRVRHLLAPLLTVLDRAGAVRSLHVDHGRGHVLIGRRAGAALAVSGDSDLNLGAIYAAFRALEEEP